MKYAYTGIGLAVAILLTYATLWFFGTGPNVARVFVGMSYGSWAGSVSRGLYLSRRKM